MHNNDDEDLTYWRHRTPVGVKIEEISGGSRYSDRLWPIMARQIWSENGRDNEYRTIDHLPDGVPLLDGSHERISISHTRGMMVVATLPPTPEVNLEQYSPRAAMGVDTERADRSISAEVRSRILTPAEQEIVPQHKTLLAWTCKEALYKAVMGQAKHWDSDYTITALPDPDKGTTGSASVMLPGGSEVFILYSWLSEGFIITLALSAQCATYKKTADKKGSDK